MSEQLPKSALEDTGRGRTALTSASKGCSIAQDRLVQKSSHSGQYKAHSSAQRMVLIVWSLKALRENRHPIL